MKHTHCALRFASTVAFAVLAFIFSIIAFSSVYLVVDEFQSTSRLPGIVDICVALFALATLLSVVVTGILQIRKARPTLTKFTALLSLGWPIFTFGLYAVILLRLGVTSDVPIDDAKDIAGEAMALILPIVGLVGAALIIPFIRNCLFQPPYSTQPS